MRVETKNIQNYNNWLCKSGRKEIQPTWNDDTYIVTITRLLDEKTLSEDEMNNVDTARKSNATSATTGKRKASWTGKIKLISAGKTEN